MAGVTSCRKTHELSSCGLLMTGVAFNQRVRSHQREAVLVIANRIQGNIPPPDRMAVLAASAKLPPMNIGMTIGAASTDVFEDQAGVTLRAVHLLMHAPQWVSRLVVIKIWIGTDRLPTDR